MNKEMFKLTAREIKWLDELTADKEAADHTLRIALTYHSNCMNEYKKKNNEWWETMSEKYNFDLSDVYEAKKIESAICIVKKEDDK